jgi:membrane-anchored protein YejM (alkaline phosphatase superfamily)
MFIRMAALYDITYKIKKGRVHTMTTDNKRKPNLIYVFADQLRYRSCGFAGDEKAHTPNIDKFAAESVSFSNAISGYPVLLGYLPVNKLFR